MILEKKFLPLIKYTLLLLPVFIINLYILKQYFKKLNLSKSIKIFFLFAFFIIADLSLIIFSVKSKSESILKLSAYTNMLLIIFNISLITVLPTILLAKLTKIKKFFTFALIPPLIIFIILTHAFIQGLKQPRLNKMEFYFKNLSPDLNNLKIAQISDLHLSFFLRINYLNKIVKKLNSENIDILLITGDFVDDYEILDEALEKVKKVKTKYGLYAVLGNHEYYRGMDFVKNTFKRHNVTLLINDIRRIKVKNTHLTLLGVDDPGKTGFDPSDFLKKALDKTLSKLKTNNDFKILMSHRPNIFPYANQKKINLVLSGHTHGGQIAFKNKFLFSFLSDNKYWLGKYKINDSILYVTSGTGTWFPIRINCPSELPVITLGNKETTIKELK